MQCGITSHAFTLIHSDSLWFTLIHSDSQWFTLIHHDSPWFTRTFIHISHHAISQSQQFHSMPSIIASSAYQFFTVSVKIMTSLPQIIMQCSSHALHLCSFGSAAAAAFLCQLLGQCYHHHHLLYLLINILKNIHCQPTQSSSRWYLFILINPS